MKKNKNTIKKNNGNYKADSLIFALYHPTKKRKTKLKTKKNKKIKKWKVQK